LIRGRKCLEKAFGWGIPQAVGGAPKKCRPLFVLSCEAFSRKSEPWTTTNYLVHQVTKSPSTTIPLARAKTVAVCYSNVVSLKQGIINVQRNRATYTFEWSLLFSKSEFLLKLVVMSDSVYIVPQKEYLYPRPTNRSSTRTRVGWVS